MCDEQGCSVAPCVRKSLFVASRDHLLYPESNRVTVPSHSLGIENLGRGPGCEKTWRGGPQSFIEERARKSWLDTGRIGREDRHYQCDDQPLGKWHYLSQSLFS